ncbi:ABC transporter permease [Fodinisporobacter ferrooxydans]|uniref:ABC transporter permease n=1 Tax=Fodinisporobacter ferrooxydans TaxID=2901836 RepID=A0ABY4CEE7_9BACL|nr:ABC transporter permease [Alicyclobacillaceae bacterium MYW30-H2]
MWWILSIIPQFMKILPGPPAVITAFIKGIQGTLFTDIGVSLMRVAIGFVLAFIIAVPVGFLMGWYRWAQGIFEPWIQFFRTIPPIALIPMVVIVLGIGESAKIFVIWAAAFLTIVISVYQGVKNVDITLLKAAKVLGANDWDLFFDVVIPASFPYILVGVRIGLASAWSTLVAAELIASQHGLGSMIEQAGLYYQVSIIILGILLIGVIGFLMDRGVLWMERRLTGWQEKVS